jgi:predicted lipoprotein
MQKASKNQGPAVELESHFQVQAAPVAWLALLLSLGCAPVALSDGERRQALEDATEQVILPTYAELSLTTAALSERLTVLTETPDADTLGEAREAYLATRAPLGESQAFGFGPAEELRSTAALDQHPIDAEKLEAELSSDATLTPKYLRSVGANKRGLHGIEYLLFPEGDAELEAALLADDEAGARRRQYAASAAAIVAESAAALEAAWTPEGEDYARRFSQPGGQESVSADVQAGLDTLLNQAVFLTEVIANEKLGLPLGAKNGGDIDPSAQESERSGTSLGDALANLRGVRHVYFGSRDGSVGPSLSSLVRGKSPAADLHARQALDDAEQKLLAVPEPLTDALSDAPEAVTAAFESLKTLKRVLATEVLGTLGASLKFNDNDGD